MDQARYARVEDLFRRAIELAPEEQISFLEKQCEGDPELLSLVQNLLDQDREGPILHKSQARMWPPAFGHDLSGRTLSHYRVHEPIGKGGMATVYRATDIRLERPVALKFLPPHVIHDPASHERFLREARAIASIDNPNVCTVYEIEEADGFFFIAMAYLQGTPLDRRIAKGPLPLADALEIAIQTAQGLEAAHANGIVHRDIKPANLMLIDATSRPLVRILDFGIAQWMERTALTQGGLTIGTISYMAPEQIVQSRVDARADIWSLGVVLYQMLSGRLPFAEGSTREVLAAIAGPKPADLAALGPSTPANVIPVVGKMLEKDPAARYQTAQELIADLEIAAGRRQSGGIVQVHRPRRWVWVACTALVAAVLSAALFTSNRNRPAAEPELRPIPVTFYPGYEQNPAISPDGKQIAFVGQGKFGTDPLEVYVQFIGSTDPLRLTRNLPDVFDSSPVWDSNGTRIAFLRTRTGERFGRILVVSALGGPETDLGVDGAFGDTRLSWNPNGRSLSYTGLNRSGQEAIFELSLDDHSIRQRSFPRAGQSDCCAQFDPSGRRLAFKRNEVEILVTGDGKQPERALPARSAWPGLAWTPDGGSIVYSWFGNLATVNVSSGSIKRTGVAIGPNISDVNIRGTRMAFVRWDFEHSIWELDIHRQAGSASRITAVSQKQLIASTLREDTPQFSPDGQWIAFASERSGSIDIWIGRRDGSSLRRLTFLQGNAGTPRWSPDGKWIAFDARPPSSKPDIYIVRAAGGEARRLTTIAGGADMPSWSQDGRWIYYHLRSDDQIWKMPVVGGAPIQVTRQNGFEGFESADGKYLYYSKTDGKSGIWRRDIVNAKEEAIPELAQAGQFRHWALGSRGVYFVPNGEALKKDAAVRYFDFATRKTVRVASLGRLVTAGPGALAVSSDETSLLYVHVDRDNRDIMLVDRPQ